MVSSKSLQQECGVSSKISDEFITCCASTPSRYYCWAQSHADDSRQGADCRKWQALFKDCNAVLDRLGRYVWASRNRASSECSQPGKRALAPDCKRPGPSRNRASSECSQPGKRALAPDCKRPGPSRDRASSECSQPGERALAPSRERPWTEPGKHSSAVWRLLAGVCHSRRDAPGGQALADSLSPSILSGRSTSQPSMSGSNR